MSTLWLQPEEFLATLPRFILGTVVLVPDPAGRLLMLHDAPSPERDAAGFDARWLPVGGHLGTGEDAATAADRELREETGLQLPLMFLGTVSIAPEKHKPAKVNHWFAASALTKAQAAMVRLSHEHDEHRFVPEQELSALVGERQAAWIREFLAASRDGRTVALLEPRP